MLFVLVTQIVVVIMDKYYTGIGSRSTPPKILKLMGQLGNLFKGTYILRSGGAPGADLAFEEFLEPHQMHIYLPWKGFNDHKSDLHTQSFEAINIASQLHPAWKSLKPSVKKLMSRNAHQVMGNNCRTPSDFVICWTKDGASARSEVTGKTGGTGLAISAASAYGIPIYNLGKEEVLEALLTQYNLKEWYESI